MGLLDFFDKAISPITTLIDELTTSDEEKGKLVNEMAKMQNSLASRLLDYEARLLEVKSKIIVAEASGQSWLQRNWRPLTMLTFLVLVCLDSFGVLAFRLNEQAWSLLQIGLGGYVVGRSAEKIVDKIKFNKN